MKRSSTRKVAPPVDVDIPAVDPSAKLVGRGIYKNKVFGLKTLRELSEKTQVQVAASMGSPQSFVSKVEAAAAEPELATLRRYAEALGGELQVRVVLGGRSYRVM